LTLHVPPTLDVG